MRLVAIGDHTQSVRKWNPKTEAPDDEFIYIDIASVSQEQKQVNGVSHLLGSDAPSRARQLVRTGDVVVSTVRPNLNAVAYIPEEFDGATASTGFSVLRSNPKKLDPRYLYHWVRSKEFVSNMIKQATGQSYPAVSDKIVKHSEIPLPPLDEQKRTAAILDQADALRRLRQRALNRLNTLGQAIFHEMFSSEQNPAVKRLSDIAELINGDRSSNYPSGDDIKEDGILFLSTKNISDWRLALNRCQFITPEKFQSLSRGKLQRGDIIITLRGTLGQAAIFDCEHDTGFINAQMMIIRPKKGIDSDYLLDFIALDSTQHSLMRGQSGSAVKQLTAKQIGELEVVVPAEDQQSKYKERMASIRYLRSKTEMHARNFEELFASLQSRAFRGEL